MNEIDTQLEIADELGFLEGMDLSELRSTFDKTSSQLQSLISSIRSKLN